MIYTTEITNMCKINKGPNHGPASNNMGAGPASYGMTDTMGRMHSDAQFAGSSSV